jgi:MFS family permease
MYLSLLNLLVANMQTGFGAFISVHLTSVGWDPGRIGLVLSAGTIASIVAQVPAGMLVDASSFKRNVAAAGILGAMLALLVLAMAPGVPLVLAAMLIAGASGPLLTLSIAAITLALTPQPKLGERLGMNARFAAIGAASGAGLLGLIGTTFSPAAVFVTATAVGVPALWVLFNIRRRDLLLAPQHTDHLAAPIPAYRRRPAARKWRVLLDRRLIAFVACAAAFHLSNAALLPLAAADAARRAGDLADLITGAATVVPQVLVAMLSPWVGRTANKRGRRFILLLGFAALPTRALLFAFDGSAQLLVPEQALDGVSAAVFGVLMPLVVADITHNKGRFNLALGVVGVAASVGATASNTLAGAIADAAGLQYAFFALATAGAGATALVWLIMPETAHLPVVGRSSHQVAAKAPISTDIA